MDGNQRWSKINKKNKIDGYNHGLNKIYEIVNFCLDKNIKYLTIYALSSENLERKNVALIYKLIETKYINFLNQIKNKENVKINIIGDKKNIPKNIQTIFSSLEEKKNINQLTLNIAFNYGSKNEIINIVNKFIEIKSPKIEENDFSQIKKRSYLGDIPDPDILIRTGGYKRLSNFLLIYLSYTELFFTKTLWPDFEILELDNIIQKYFKIHRTYGL